MKCAPKVLCPTFGAPQLYSNKFCFPLGLDKFLTLDIENKLSLFSLNWNFALSFASRKIGGASAMQEKLFFLAIALGLDKFLTLDNENKLSLFSLNRNFALSLRSKKLLILRKGYVPRQKPFHNLI